MKKLLTALLFIAGLGLVHAQSNTVATFAKTANGYNAYLYKSLIRMANTQGDPDFNALVKDLDHVRLIATEEIGEAAKPIFKSLEKGLQAEGYEEIMSFDNKEGRCRLYTSDSGDDSSWIALMLMEGRAGVFEMNGSINPDYLHALSGADLSSINDMLMIDDLLEGDSDSQEK